MERHLTFGTLLLVILVISGCQQNRRPADFIDPFIGTGGHGHTFPGAAMPFGMVQLSPDTRIDGWDGCSGYHYSDSLIYGFSHTHLSGTGCSDYGDILLMPVSKTVDLSQYTYASAFRKSTEYARAGYYRVTLDKWNVKAELTASERAGFHRYQFRKGDSASVVIDLKHRDEVLESAISIVSDTEVTGCRISRNWAEKQILYFVARFSVPMTGYRVMHDSVTTKSGNEFTGKAIKAQVSFTNTGDPLLVKVGISAVSIEGARKNLEAEIPGWNFDAVRDSATAAWNRELSRISVKGGTAAQRTVFYTALYHLMMQPNLYTDADRRYRGRDLQVHTADGFGYYTVFSLWDTYRAAHPLMTLIDRKRTSDFIQTFVRQYEEGGMLPVWELSGNETGCMIGYHAVPVIADAWIKGIKNFDTLKAYEAMKHSAMQDHLGLSWYKNLGYIPGDKECESVSRTLEYAYDDWCIAQVAKGMGQADDYNHYIRRAQQYRNLFDPATRFMRARINGGWFTPFDPAEVNFHYTEANAWQYSFYVPQDIDGLIDLMGGREKFITKLDSLFTVNSKTTGRDQADITGLIGQYAHGNEPSHHMAYLYDFTGAAWKTQELVHRICKELYSPMPDGLIGNEDCGQMSSWYLFSAMGFYPVTPGSGTYAIGTPLFPEITINLENGKKFAIRANGLSDKNYYVTSITLDGMQLDEPFISHSDIMKGGELVFEMDDEPKNEIRKTKYESGIKDALFQPVPFVAKGEATFFDSTVVELKSIDEKAGIFFTLTPNPLPGVPSTDTRIQNKFPGTLYKKPLTLRQSATLTAYARREDGLPSPIMEAVFQKIPKNRKIVLNTRYEPQYSAGGDIALIDFKNGSDDFRTGFWQGYEGVDLDAVVDLGKPQAVRELKVGFIQDQRSWIFMPEWVECMVSTDGRSYSSAGKIINDIPWDVQGVVLKYFSLTLKGQTVRFIRVIARNRGICPDGHPAAGNKAWIFSDEIIIDD